METALMIAGACAAALAVAALTGRPLLRWLRQKEAAQAFRQFRVQREQLEAKFVDLASRLGKPRDLRWLDCDWQSDVAFGRDVRTGMLTAFVAVNIRFEAVEGGDMEFVEAVGLLRDAAAVFHYQNGRWGTGGRALFNMNPDDALARLADQYEPVEAECLT